jgi:hypothetical protein
VRTTRRGSTLVDVADNQVTAVLAPLRRLPADPFEGQDNQRTESGQSRDREG